VGELTDAQLSWRIPYTITLFGVEAQINELLNDPRIVGLIDPAVRMPCRREGIEYKS
jgi:hypothetical protein